MMKSTKSIAITIALTGLASFGYAQTPTCNPKTNQTKTFVAGSVPATGPNEYYSVATAPPGQVVYVCAVLTFSTEAYAGISLWSYGAVWPDGSQTVQPTNLWNTTVPLLWHLYGEFGSGAAPIAWTTPAQPDLWLDLYESPKPMIVIVSFYIA